VNGENITISLEKN